MRLRLALTVLVTCLPGAALRRVALAGEPARDRPAPLPDGGFVSLFDGKTLAGWRAVPKGSASDWTVRDGAIVGRGSANRLAYLVWREEDLADFVLTLRYRLPGKGNTGVEVRCRPDTTGKRPFEGYHADLGHVGIGPHILGAWDFHFARRPEPPCPRGTRLLIDENGKPHAGRIDGAVTLAEIRPHQWNDVRIAAEGNRFRFFLNDKLSSEFTDNARRGRLDRGAVGLQIHDKGMVVEFKDIRLQRLGPTTPGAADQQADLGLQLADNPPMRTISRTPPAPPAATGSFETREGFRLIETLDAFRAACEKSGQKVRMKPGVYRAVRTAEPRTVPHRHAKPGEDGQRPVNRQEHVFAINGSSNHFDLRGVVFETPVSVQSRLTGKAHVADTWHVNGANNTFEGGYFRNVTDRPYPTYRVTENEFEVCNDNTTFLNCTFVLRGSVPYGYTDYYGKGGPNFGRLNKHSFLSIQSANNTRLIGCKVFMQSFGHCVHFHQARRVRIERCLFSGTLRPTNDIFRETVGRAREYGFQIMYRGKRPIPRDQMIPLTEDGVRSYNEVRDITVVDTTVERMRGCFQLLCTGDVTLENVTVREAGDFAFDLSSGDRGRVVMKNCRADLAYTPLFNLTRGAVPVGAFYEVTILSPASGVRPTARTSLGTICGHRCTFLLHDGTTRPLPPEVNRLYCGGKKALTDSSITNHTRARLILARNVRNCRIRSVGPVEDNGQQNTVFKIEK